VKFGIFALPTYFPEVDGSIADFYQHILQLLVDSEALGFDAAWVNEHHFHPYGGMIPSPPVLLAALATRTSRIRLGTSVALLPLHNPLQAAEAYAMVDQISGGRLDLGIGRGFVKNDYDTFDVPWAEGQARLLESLEVVLAAWQHQPFSHHGHYFQFDDVPVWPPPLQRPHPPVWGAASRTPESFAWFGTHGYNLLTVMSLHSLEGMAKLIGLYRDAATAAGHDLSRLKISTHYQIYCHEDRVEAWRDGERAIRAYSAQLTDARGRGHAVPPTDQELSLEELLAQGRVCIGTPDDCAAVLERARDTLGLASVDGTFYFGGLDYAKSRRSFELFAREVMPRFQAQPLAAPARA